MNLSFFSTGAKGLAVLTFVGITVQTSTAQNQPFWNLTGNNNIQATDYLGTNNNQSLTFKTYSQTRLTITLAGSFLFPGFAGQGSGIFIFDNSGTLGARLFTGSGDDVLLGNGTFGNLNTLAGWKYNGNNLFNMNSGNIGVGIINPLEKLHVNGNILASGSVTATQLNIVQRLEFNSGLCINDGSPEVCTHYTDLKIQSKPGYNFNTIINANQTGNVGIGTSSPQYKLDVNGNTRVSGTLFANSLQVTGAIGFTNMHVADRIQIGQSIIIDGLSNTNPNNHIYTDATVPTELLIQSQPSPADYNTIINASNNGKVGLGILTPQTKFHYHNDQVFTNSNDPSARHANCCVADNFALRFDQYGDPIPLSSTGPVPTVTTYGQNDFLITNSTTGNSSTDGLLIGTVGNDGYIRLQETGHLAINSGNGMTIFTNNGNVSLRTTNGNTLVQGNNIIFRTNSGGTRMYINSTGNIGVGMTNPQYKLDVCGVIRAKEVRVNLTGCDFVFEDGYKLMPLGELEQFISKNKHLPEVAPAKEMETADGVEVGQLQSKLLQKVEELTLYVIQQNKKIEELEKQLQEGKK
jgi:hypothetical protein